MIIRLSTHILGALLICFSLSLGIHADYCPRCVKIETAHAAEQAKRRPQPVNYYDEFIAETNNLKKDNDFKADKINPSNPENTKGGPPTEQKYSYNGIKSALWLAAADIIVNRTDSQTGESVGRGQKENFSQFPQENRIGVPINKADTRESLKRLDYVDQASTLFDILSIKNLFSTLEGPFSLFIPSDEAIQNFPMETFRNMLKPENRELLYSLITNHIVAEEILRNNFSKTFKTLGGRLIELKSSERGLTVNGAKVLKSEPIGNAGVVYVIDQVLIPIYVRE